MKSLPFRYWLASSISSSQSLSLQGSCAGSIVSRRSRSSRRGGRLTTILWLLPFIWVCGLSASPASSALFSDRYDADIRTAVKRWWPDYPHWTSWKAQLYQESLLDPAAVSPVGARGLAQFMPGTWAEVSRELGLGPVSPHVAKHAINAGAYYMAKLRHSWRSPRPNEDRHKLAQASYNAGLGNILRSQRACGMAVLYSEIIACLPQITGRHSRETITYVERIAQWRSMLERRGP